ncbi:nucleoside triphosphate pyrophosphohydrolase [Nannocystis pusilla]|uniref:nucleoside triphosphate pyrophosphohydrolase n=1 Tax=Nannocystis pusilla TaxID=889268 RepID=UPI003BF017F9
MKLPRDPSEAKPDSPAGAAEPAVPDHRALGLRDGLDGLRDLMDRLLADPGGCPWDRAQTLDTLRPYLIEEAYEVLDALSDPQAHRRELGDLLFQIVFQSALREREGAFDLGDVVAAIRDKMIRRHPHVFAPTAEDAPRDADDVARQWSQLKRAENLSEGTERGPARPLAGVPRSLPALQRAWRLQDKAAAVGFDWPTIQGPVDKIREEWEELERARAEGEPKAIEEEFGDLLFVLVRYGQKMGIAAEDALRGTCAKFEARFAYVMERCHAAGIEPEAAGLERLDGWWDEAKARARAGGTKSDVPKDS